MKLNLIIGLIFALITAPAIAGKKVALVIGNAAYSVENGRLSNPVNDAKSISQRLKQLGFKVLYRSNLTDKEAMETAVEEFSGKIGGAEIALFYYSGHGVQRNGKNYLMPTQAKINNAGQIRHRAMNVSFLMDEMAVNSHGLSLVMLDACRDDPYPRDSKSSSSRGLARMSAPSGTIIAYATKPGATAADGIGKHSPYTEQLLRHLNDFSQQPIDDVLNKINVAVEDATGNKQSPRLEISPLRVVPCFAVCEEKNHVQSSPVDLSVPIKRTLSGRVDLSVPIKGRLSGPVDLSVPIKRVQDISKFKKYETATPNYVSQYKTVIDTGQSH